MLAAAGRALNLLGRANVCQACSERVRRDLGGNEIEGGKKERLKVAVSDL